MTHREKVISNLCILRTWAEVNPKYGKGLNIEDYAKAVKWIDDTLELLQAQEPKRVNQDRECEIAPTVWKRKGFCPNCHQEVLWETDRTYCGFCGQGVAWE